MRKYLTILLVAIPLIGCAKRLHLNDEDLKAESAWPNARQSVAARGAILQATFSGQLTEVWHESLGDKPAAPITLDRGMLIYPSTKKRVRFFDALNGSPLGVRKIKGIPQAGMILDDSLAFVAAGPPKDRLWAVNLKNRKNIWSVELRDPLAAPIIVDNRLIVSCAAGRVYGIEVATGRISWTFDTGGRCSAPASASDSVIFQPTDKGVVHALTRSGVELYRFKVDGPVASVVAVAQLLYVTDVTGNVYGVQPSEGQIVWKTKLAGPIWTSPAVGDRLYLGHSGGEIVALDKSNGAVVWTFPTIDVVRASPTLVGEFVIAGTLSGKLYVLNAGDGTLVAKTELKGGIAVPVVSDGERIYVATQAGRIHCFGDINDGNASLPSRDRSQTANLSQ